MKALQKEEIMNVFTDDWKALGTGAEAGDWPGKVSEGLMLYQALTNQKYAKDKKVSCINWHPTIYGKVHNFNQGTASHRKILIVASLAISFKSASSAFSVSSLD